MKKLIKDIVKEQGGKRVSDPLKSNDPNLISSCAAERTFFRLLRSELKKISRFFSASQDVCRIRYQCLQDGFIMLQDHTALHDDGAWSRLLMACVKFYKDVLLLENFAIMNYCGFSKIMKKHDKTTGFSTREPFMLNVMSQQNFTHHPYVVGLVAKLEKLFIDIQSMER
jgi:SPX domain protein involved in polyphosphate accumulation